MPIARVRKQAVQLAVAIPGLLAAWWAPPTAAVGKVTKALAMIRLVVLGTAPMAGSVCSMAVVSRTQRAAVAAMKVKSVMRRQGFVYAT